MIRLGRQLPRYAQSNSGIKIYQRTSNYMQLPFLTIDIYRSPTPANGGNELMTLDGDRKFQYFCEKEKDSYRTMQK